MKRLFDAVVAFIGLLLLSPVCLLIALLIKLDSPGPILYSQCRVGCQGIMFRLYKFRSMVANADQLGSRLTTSRDLRITRIGRLLRKTKLDELPQLWNVLTGEMSLVGPRPDVPEIVATYTPAMKRILTIRPGMTSNASLYLRDEEALLASTPCPDEAYAAIVVPAKVELAMAHVDNASFWFDLDILIQTVWVLTFGRLFQQKDHPIVTQLRERMTES
jgi:lipopolysaccharide/colanic/teichoic acid biosynthesis glycosyltransferase